MARRLRRLRGTPGLSANELQLFARSLAASPDENFLPSADLHTRSGREKIHFQVGRMSAAIRRGCPATTLDTDLWIDLPPADRRG